MRRASISGSLIRGTYERLLTLTTKPAFAIKANAGSCKLPFGSPSRSILVRSFFVSFTMSGEL